MDPGDRRPDRPPALTADCPWSQRAARTVPIIVRCGAWWSSWSCRTRRGTCSRRPGSTALTSAEDAPDGAVLARSPRAAISAIGSTFTAEQPDPAALAPAMLEQRARGSCRGSRREPRGLRACARPGSADGRPMLGPLPGHRRAHVASGHGAWGITLGPASARLVADQLLGRPVEIPPALARRSQRRRRCRADPRALAGRWSRAARWRPPIRGLSVVAVVSASSSGRRVGGAVLLAGSLEADDLRSLPVP